MNIKEILGKFPVYFKRTLLRDTVIESADITRYAIKDGKSTNEVAMSTDAAMAYVDRGTSTWRIDKESENGIVESKPETARVTADWFTATDALRAGIKVVSGSSANTFGSMGALLVPDGFKIPGVEASPENVRYYGLSLIKDGNEITVKSPECDIIMMKYDYTSIYREEFLMKKEGGGGVFVETHNFPHIHMPLNEKCEGYIVIGKKISEREFDFTAFKIPFGYALYTPPNTIHGDGTLVGEYGLTVADPAMAGSDTVLIYNKSTLSMAKGIVP